MTKEEFFRKLEKHDWYYEYSDDGRVWRAGTKAEEELKLIAVQNGWMDLYTAFSKHYFSGPSWNTEKAPLPYLET